MEMSLSVFWHHVEGGWEADLAVRSGGEAFRQDEVRVQVSWVTGTLGVSRVATGKISDFA